MEFQTLISIGYLSLTIFNILLFINLKDYKKFYEKECVANNI